MVADRQLVELDNGGLDYTPATVNGTAVLQTKIDVTNLAAGSPALSDFAIVSVGGVAKKITLANFLLALGFSADAVARYDAATLIANAAGAITGLLKGAANGTFTAAAAGTDYQAPIAAGVSGQFLGHDLTWHDLETAEVTETGAGPFFWTQAKFDAALAAITTDDLAEGSTNQYHTTARARAAIDVAAGSGLSYASGVVGVAGGYAIPTSAEHAQWDTAYQAALGRFTVNFEGQLAVPTLANVLITQKAFYFPSAATITRVTLHGVNGVDTSFAGNCVFRLSNKTYLGGVGESHIDLTVASTASAGTATGSVAILATYWAYLFVLSTSGAFYGAQLSIEF